jgi:hypothetical protein
MKPLYLSDDRELPAVYTVTQFGGRWYAESPSGRRIDDPKGIRNKIAA